MNCVTVKFSLSRLSQEDNAVATLRSSYLADRGIDATNRSSKSPKGVLK